jgi:DNA-binding MarR family transcriptional regulator
MSKKTRPADIYVRFLQLAEAIRGLPSLPPLDPLEERILSLVARSAQETRRLSVRDMMSIDELGSPATIHGRLKSMRKKGWIQLLDTEDARRKQVSLTPAALKHLDKLSQCLVRATQEA